MSSYSRILPSLSPIKIATAACWFFVATASYGNEWPEGELPQWEQDHTAAVDNAVTGRDAVFSGGIEVRKIGAGEVVGIVPQGWVVAPTGKTQDIVQGGLTFRIPVFRLERLGKVLEIKGKGIGESLSDIHKNAGDESAWAFSVSRAILGALQSPPPSTASSR